MSETTPNAKGPAPFQTTPVTTEPTLIPADQVRPEDLGALSIAYRDGQPVIVVSGGTFVPGSLVLVDASGNPLAEFTAGRVSAAVQARISPSTFNQYAFSRNDPINFVDLNGN
ncbi:hypothetical protein [Streptomyces europaeiscabiei]|uniref:hypothetical protein n=1 Tax=Streptomyces europaeiscabiei TaxID=146819 RepID=UPI0038F7AE65